MAHPFPSPLERTVASALLLLSSVSLPPFPSSIKPARSLNNTEEKLSSSSFLSSRSCSSSLTSDRGSSSHHLRLVAVAARCHITKHKVARRKRSKVMWTCPDREGKIVKSQITETESFSSSVSGTDSCISNAHSISMPSATSHGGKVNADQQPKQAIRSAHMRRRAEAILKLLSGGCYSEVRIREFLGDSPDTSKALRILLKREEVKRSGTGGRCDPYIYTVA